MNVLQVKILKPKARRILEDLAELKLITVKEEKELFPLSEMQKKSIEVGKRQIKKGQFKSNKEVISGLKKWVKSK